MPSYELVYRRVVTVESETELSRAELIEIAEEGIYDKSGMWTVGIDDKWYVCPQPPAPAMAGG